MKKYRKAAIPPFILFLMLSFCLIFVYSMLAEWLYHGTIQSIWEKPAC